MQTHESEPIVEEILEHLGQPGSPAPAVLVDFARSYFRRIPADYRSELRPAMLSGQVRSLFEFARLRRGRDVSVRAFNPEPATDGYQLPGGVVEVIAPDMSFLVDSVTNEIRDQGFTIERVYHPVIGTTRNAAGELEQVLPARKTDQRESIQHYEIESRISPEEATRLEVAIRNVLSDVRRAVRDFEPMRHIIQRMVEITRQGAGRYDAEEVEESVNFLEWLLDDNFVFLGYREYEISHAEQGQALSVLPESGLGILAKHEDSQVSSPVLLADLPPALKERYETGYLVVVTKTNSVSRVHRRARMDYIGVRMVDAEGAVTGEARLLGLFTSKAYMTPAEAIPILRRKLNQVLDAEDVISGSHLYKEIVQIFDSFPKEELFATPQDDIRQSIVGLVQLQEREKVRLFVRNDLLSRNISLLVVIPRDRFDAELRMAIHDHIRQRFGGAGVDYRLALGEMGMARVHFTVWMGDSDLPEVPFEELESEILKLSRTWDENIEDRLVESLGAEHGLDMARRWNDRFPSYYRSSTDQHVTIGDIMRLDELEAGPESLVVGIQQQQSDTESLTRIAVYKSGDKLELSAIMPTLEHFGLRVVEEVPTRLHGDPTVFIHDFGVLGADGAPLDVDRCGRRIAATIKAVLSGEAESDSLNPLIISGGLDHRQVAILRAYRVYWQRVGTGFTNAYLDEAFLAHPDIASDLIRLFEARFRLDGDNWQEEGELVNRIATALDAVQSLDQDRILRAFLGMILATVRTNAMKADRTRLVLKFDSAEVPGMPAPAPAFEIFVYAPDVEGIHLRGGRISRGGIRWSVRREDYRSEVLGLMKAQMTKNAVIVPTGAKGGFVLRRSEQENPTIDHVRSAYETFIRGLLDVTDNLIGGTISHPAEVRVHDEPDPYLVVAADRGTATFSNLANEIAGEYGFWLGDAFASGGSEGYDHKALGITAKGAWESVRRHFREAAIDPETTPFTVVGIGDMSGDVFGNGMLETDQIQLVAAFDHRHVFIDPNPNPVSSYAERRRLFELGRSSWDDYDKALLSPGGGIYPRSAKQIELSAEAQRALGIEEAHLTPAELIQSILRVPVDLMWNGGIGTYVKASDETHTEVSDRTNDAVRVNGTELRAQVVGEGGNLGLTQRGRIEFARAGGRVFTDFIDNSGGVNCSDREVNLKILLDLAVDAGEIDVAKRNQLIQEVAGDVVERILYDNYLQAQILAQENDGAATRMETYEELMVLLESDGILHRELELLPTSEEMVERSRSGVGLTGPELSVLLTYAKRSLRDALIESDMLEGIEHTRGLNEYFPKPIVDSFSHHISNHPLRTQLMATITANDVVNSEGITFVSRLMSETAASAPHVVTAYQVARVVTDATERWQSVESMTGRIPPDIERELLADIDALVESVARWLLLHPQSDAPAATAARLRPAFQELSSMLADVGPATWSEACEVERKRFVQKGVPADIAAWHAYHDDLAHALDIIEMAGRTDRSLRDVAAVFLQLGGAVEIEWLERQLSGIPAASRWHRPAIQSVRDDLVELRRELAEGVFEESEGRPARDALDHYLVSRVSALGRLTRFVHAVSAEGVRDVESALVAVQHIRSLLRKSTP